MSALESHHPDDAQAQGTGPTALFKAAELQDHLLTARNDLERLERLLNDACDTLLQGFHGAAQQIETALGQGHFALDGADAHLKATMHTLYRAVTALQFQDMATQLIQHTNARLRNCADQLAQDALGEESDGEAVIALAPIRPNPVTQDEMDAGSVELF